MIDAFYKGNHLYIVFYSFLKDENEFLFTFCRFLKKYNLLKIFSQNKFPLNEAKNYSTNKYYINLHLLIWDIRRLY